MASTIIPCEIPSQISPFLTTSRRISRSYLNGQSRSIYQNYSSITQELKLPVKELLNMWERFKMQWNHNSYWFSKNHLITRFWSHTESWSRMWFWKVTFWGVFSWKFQRFFDKNSKKRFWFSVKRVKYSWNSRNPRNLFPKFETYQKNP